MVAPQRNRFCLLCWTCFISISFLTLKDLTKTNRWVRGGVTSSARYGEPYVEYGNHVDEDVPSGFRNARTSIDESKQYDLCVVGAGLSGTVFAERTANLLGQQVLVLDSRKHIGGNCFDFRDPKTGILMNKYGSHLFHTNIERVWNYVNNPKAPAWKAWYHEKVGLVNGTYVPIPANIRTVNTIFNLNIQTDDEMKEWLATVQIPCENNVCKNGEDMAKSRVGDRLYKAIFEMYTIKQWGKSPREMDASVTARIPVRSNFDPRYFADKFQALPEHGYTAWFAALLDHPNIDVVLSTDFFEHQAKLEESCGKIVYTGPIDRYFQGMEKLEYRSLEFHEERYYHHTGYVLPTPVVNYPGPETPFTRAVEYKQYLHRPSPHSIVVRETSSDNGEPYYPVPTDRNKALYEQYKQLVNDLEQTGKIQFVGRLANYKYFNMDQAIDNALDLFYDSHWSTKFVGENFLAYKSEIDTKMRELRDSRRSMPSLRSDDDACALPEYFGEFGTELRVMVPWAYAVSKNCTISTVGSTGTKYMYFFSDNHTVKDIKRSNQKLPPGNPFRSDVVYMEDFPYDTPWLSPPFKQFFDRPDVRKELQEKPLLFISNKYRREWKRRPSNFFNVDTLHEILTHLTEKYTVVYKRYTDNKLKDWEDKEMDLGEKEMIRLHFPSVILFEQLADGINDSPEDQNLLMFSLMATSDAFLSVQGGMAVASSYFGGNTAILIRKGTELNTGGYSYFHRFSGANVVWKQTDRDFIEVVKQRF